MPIVRMGICAPRSGDEVESARTDEGIETAQSKSSRTFGSSAFIFRGVKTRERSPR